MKVGVRFVLAAAIVAIVTSAALAQGGDPKKPGSALGDLSAVDAAKGVLTIKLSTGADVHASVSSATEYLLIEPGKKDLAGAEKIDLSDLKVGDRVWARGDNLADGSVTARQIIVMSASAIADRNQRDAADWQARGVIGEVTNVDTATGSLTVQTYRGETIAVSTSASTTMRHLNSGATDLSSSVSITIGDIRPGNQIAMRGERSADRTQLSAETLLTGDFPKPLRGRVTAVDTKLRVATIAAQDGKPVTLEIPDNALVRKLTPAVPRPQGAQASDNQRGPRGFAFALGDRDELDRRTTSINLVDIKPGDFVFAIVESGAQSAQPRVRVVVKFEIPADRTPRQQGAPSIGDAGMGDLPF